MAVYEDGTRDCERCIDLQRNPPNRVRTDRHDDPVYPGKRTAAPFCDPCLRVIHNDATAGFGELELFMRKHLADTDWRIEHGEDITK